MHIHPPSQEPEKHATEALQGCNASRKDALRTRRAAWGKYDAASKMQQGRRKEIEERKEFCPSEPKIISLGTQHELSEDPK